jgi:hypothetical protein
MRMLDRLKPIHQHWVSLQNFVLTSTCLWGLNALALEPAPTLEVDAEAVIVTPATHKLAHDGASNALQKTVIRHTAGHGEHRSGLRNIRVVRVADSAEHQDLTIEQLLGAELSETLPPAIQQTIEKALVSEDASDQIDVDVLVTDDKQPHVFVRAFDLSGKDWRQRPKPSGHRPIVPLGPKAAACVLKSITKVTTESGTHLLREACNAAFNEN